MRSFNYAEASKYQFMKYSLVLDFSSSIPARVRDGLVKVIDNFLGKLPLAIEGQIIKFSDRVEKFPFTRNPKDLQLQLRQPITYGMTALNDALMECRHITDQGRSEHPDQDNYPVHRRVREQQHELQGQAKLSIDIHKSGQIGANCCTGDRCLA